MTQVRHLVTQHGVPRKIAMGSSSRGSHSPASSLKSRQSYLWEIKRQKKRDLLRWSLLADPQGGKRSRGSSLNFECSDCGKRFPSSWKLERHMVVHTGERPFHCPYCQRPHTQADNLKIHIRKIHPDMPMPSLEQMRELTSSSTTPTVFLPS